MAKLLGTEYSKQDIAKYFGSLEQIAGMRRFTYDEGKAKGLGAVEFRTGSGLRFVVLLDRGLDIGLCEFQGMPVSFRAAVGEAAPQFFEPEGDNWLRTFDAGLLDTCGLTYVGAPCVDQGEALGLHGRINHLPAEQIGLDTRWNGDQCTFSVKGQVREGKTLNMNVVMYRTISTNLGDNKLTVTDTVVNEGFTTIPHMMLYHVNLGHPIVAEGSKLITNSEQVRPRDAVAEPEFPTYDTYKAPTPNYPDTVYYHKLKADSKGLCRAAVVNPALGKGLYVCYPQENLPNFIQWKFTGEGNYVTGMEPANCLPEGRAKERERNTLIFLEPGEKRDYTVEIGLLISQDEIEEFKGLF